MNKTIRILIVIAVVAMAALAFVAKQNDKPKSTAAGEPTTPATATDVAAETAVSPAQPNPDVKRPRMVDLGADKCIPCKMMAPILDELKRDYTQHFEIEFIDVWKNPGAGQQYGIRVIPTQIFYDADGEERFRHEGFLGKADILARFGQLGVNLGEAATAAAN